MAEKSTSPSEFVPAVAPAAEPRRPDVTLALLREHALELMVSCADDACDFEILNLTANPSVAWDAAVRVGRADNWVASDETLGKLVLDAKAVDKLGVGANHAMLIRQVSPNGEPSPQSLFTVILAL